MDGFAGNLIAVVVGIGVILKALSFLDQVEEVDVEGGYFFVGGRF